jgi:hypothetical protein
MGTSRAEVSVPIMNDRQGARRRDASSLQGRRPAVVDALPGPVSGMASNDRYHLVPSEDNKRSEIRRDGGI